MTSVLAFCRWQKQPRAIAVPSYSIDRSYRSEARHGRETHERSGVTSAHTHTHTRVVRPGTTRSDGEGRPGPPAWHLPTPSSEPPTGPSSQKSATGSAARKEALTWCNAPPTTIITWCASYRLHRYTGYRQFLPPSASNQSPRRPVADSHVCVPALADSQQYVISCASTCGCCVSKQQQQQPSTTGLDIVASCEDGLVLLVR